ncbi:unnamed protein product [Ilex paraguariensis]|uniref:Aluminum-activated malate transporter n=1 Tax=Ilex paraguariensis TaxID=185542 RepID=A0ABC8S188_9AQUA
MVAGGEKDRKGCVGRNNEDRKKDPRKVVHSLKVGVAMTVASLVYLLEPLYEGIRQNSIWAVLTVTLIVEFRAGATLYKGFNRLMGTVVALSFAFLFEIIARHLGHVECAISSGFAVFLIGEDSESHIHILLTQFHFASKFPVIKICFSAVVFITSTFMAESIDK